MAVDWGKKKPIGGWSLGWPVLEWIGRNLDPGKRILELGSGDGTELLTRHWDVVSVENNPKWVGHCKQTRYIYAPLAQGWYSRDVLRAELPQQYDLLLIDGPAGPARANIIPFLDMFDLTVPVVVDDVQRRPDMTVAKAIEEITKRKMLVAGSDLGRKFAVI